MKKSFYNEFEALTESGQILCDKIVVKILPLMKDYYTQGYPLREIYQVISDEVERMGRELIIRKALEKTINEIEEDS